MRLSSLVVATCFLLSTVLLAQHRTESSSSDSRSSSSSSSTSSSSSSPSYSGSSSSSSSSSSSHSSGAGYDSSSHSSPSHSSGSSGSDTYHGSTSTHTPNDSRSSHAGSEPSSRRNDRNVRNSDARQDSSRSNVATTGTTAPRTTRADNNRTVRDPKHDRTPVATDRQLKTDAKPEREKRHFFLFWRHPKRDPESDLKPKPLPPKRCKKGEDCPVTPVQDAKIQPPKRCKVGEVCPVCSSGSFPDGSGKCVPVDQCPLGGHWNGSTCEVQRNCAAGQYWNPTTSRCEGTYTTCMAGEYWDGFSCRSAVDPCQDLANQLRQQEKSLQSAADAERSACLSDPAGQRCFDLQMSYRQETDQYVNLKQQNDQCRGRAGAPPTSTIPSPHR